MKNRLLPQLEHIYNECSTHLAQEDFTKWFNQRKYKLTLGRKSITLRCTHLPEMFKIKLMRLFTHWNADLAQDLPAPVDASTSNNMGFSRKQMRLAQRRLNQMGDQQLSSLMQRMPGNAEIKSEQLNEVFDERSAQRIQNAMQ